MPITISEEEYKEIIVTDSDNNLLAMITDKGEIISADGIKVRCTPI